MPLPFINSFYQLKVNTPFRGNKDTPFWYSVEVPGGNRSLHIFWRNWPWMWLTLHRTHLYKTQNNPRRNEKVSFPQAIYVKNARKNHTQVESGCGQWVSSLCLWSREETNAWDTRAGLFSPPRPGETRQMRLTSKKQDCLGNLNANSPRIISTTNICHHSCFLSGW